jgi:2-dehydro-3-deoxyglucarate aldolase/4-hydroxy-2-oxoheptanedioate aldolase
MHERGPAAPGIIRVVTDPTILAPVPGVTGLRRRIQAGEALYGTFLGLGSPVAAEMCARAGFDWVIVDLEHGVGSESDLLASLLAIGTTSVAALVRPQSAERLRIGRALDLGAHGLMIPRLDTPEQAAEAVSWMRYPPDGSRGIALSTRGAGLTERTHADIRGINEQLTGIIQIESRGAVEGAREIAAIDGVDVLFVGPTDLSHSLGVPGQFTSPDYLAALEQVVSATDDAGKASGILLRDITALPRHLDLGFKFIGLGSDDAFVAQGARAMVQAAHA